MKAGRWDMRRLQGSPTSRPSETDYGGTGTEPERQRGLEPPERYDTFRSMRRIVPPVALFLLQYESAIGQLTFSVPKGQRNGQRAIKLLGKLLTPKALRGIAKATSHGFSAVEFDLGPDGVSRFAILPQRTIDRLPLDENGEVDRIEQIVSGRRIVIPRAKCVYSAIGEGPFGEGVLLDAADAGLKYINNRDRVQSAADDNLRRRPNLEQPDEVSEDVKKLLDKLGPIINNKNTGPGQRYITPSEPWDGETHMGDQRLITKPKWALSYPPSIPIADSSLMEVYSREIAVVLGVEAFLLGQSGVGSYALAETQRDTFTAIVHDGIASIEEALQRTIQTIFTVRGYGVAPMLVADTIDLPDPNKLATVVKILSDASRVELASPAVQHILALLGLPKLVAAEPEDPPTPPADDEEEDEEDLE